MPRRQLTDIATRHQVLLERLKAGEVPEFVGVFDQIEEAIKDVIAALAVNRLSELSKRELTATLAHLKEVNTILLNDATTELLTKLETVAADSLTFEAGALRSVAAKIKLSIPKAELAYAQALAQPLSATGQLPETFVKAWAKGEATRLNDVIRKAWGEGWTTGELSQAIRGTRAKKFKDGILAISRRNAEAVGNTAIQHVASAARMALWGANKDIVTGYRWVSTLDARTTAICRFLDGKVFKLDQGPVPPKHINCRSTTVAELDPSLKLDFLDEGATRSAQDGAVPASLTYYEWLKTQPAKFQDIALGKTRAALFRKGGLSAERFAELQLGTDFQPLTLAEMRDLAPLAFAKADINP